MDNEHLMYVVSQICFVGAWISKFRDDIEGWTLNGCCVEVTCRNHFVSEQMWNARGHIAPFCVRISTHTTLYGTDDWSDLVKLGFVEPWD